MTTLDTSCSRLSLRPAVASDLEAVAALWWHGWWDGHVGDAACHVPAALLAHRRLADFRLRVPERIDSTSVATWQTDILGFVTVRGNEIEQLYVARAARGSGAAAALLSLGERRVAAQFNAAWLAVVAGNVRARRFYARHGWCDAGAFVNQAQTAADTLAVPCLRYEKRLSHGMGIGGDIADRACTAPYATGHARPVHSAHTTRHPS
jgi:GNAT superfamily N-acetyltransferase